MADIIGSTLGKYEIQDKLGRGGMADVYQAYHPELDRFVALKKLRSDLVDNDSFRERFRQEAKAVARLRHPNIVNIFDSGIAMSIVIWLWRCWEGGH